MNLGQIITWLIVGGIAGVAADALVKGIRLGLVGAVLVGIVGAFVGGWLLGLVGLNLGAGILGEIIKALIGAVVVLIVLRWFRQRR